MLTPPAIAPGDGISIVAPASPPERRALDDGVRYLVSLGYKPKLYRDVCDHAGYLAGNDEERIAELHEAFADPDTKMVLAARGGYGVGRLLDRIDFAALHGRPKIVCGYSDITALHSAILRKAGVFTFHGPNLVGGLGSDSPDTKFERDAAWRLFTGEAGADALLVPRGDSQTLSGGTAVGTLVGGNLALLLSIYGTPYSQEFGGGVLVLEDTRESLYRLDRLLTQLRLAGVLDQIAGAVLGYFTGAGEGLDALLDEFFAPLDVPVLKSAAVGHEHPNYPLPLGARVSLDADAGELRLAEPVVAKR